MRSGFYLLMAMLAFLFIVALSAGAGACPTWEAADVCDPPRGEFTWAWAVLAGLGFVGAAAAIFRGDR